MFDSALSVVRLVSAITARSFPCRQSPRLPTPNDARRDLDEGDHGGGRRPPTDKRTGGGGDPDNWKDRRRAPLRTSRAPGPLPSRSLLRALGRLHVLRRRIVSVFFVAQGHGQRRRQRPRHQLLAAHRPFRPSSGSTPQSSSCQLRYDRDRAPQHVP